MTGWRLLVAIVVLGQAFLAHCQVEPINNDCSGAISLPGSPYNTTGSTVGSTVDFSTSTCGVSSYYKGVWYKMTGSGQAVNATAGFVDAYVTVFAGNCDFLECLGSDGGDSSYYSRNPATVAWIAEKGLTYYIWVASNYDVSYFALQLFDYKAPDNDRCSDAESIASSPFTTNGTTEGALFDFDFPFCNLPVDSRGVWYQYKGNGKLVNLSSTTNFRSSIHVFAGTCDFLECVATVSNSYSYGLPITTEFEAAQDQIYYILLTGTDGLVGEYQFDLIEYDPPANDRCSNSTAITSLPFTDKGSTVGSTSDLIFPVCSVPSDSRGVFYSYIGKGQVTRAQAQFLSTSGSRYGYLAVFEGPCDFLTCVGSISAYSSDSQGATYEWPALENVTYYILVTGQNYNSVGPHQIRVFDVPLPTNDKCDSATVITSPYSATADTAGALADVVFTACDVPAGSRGVWYRYQGQGTAVTISVYSPSSYRYPTVSVFEGSCDFLDCVTTSTTSQSSSGSLRITEWAAKQGVDYFVLVANSIDSTETSPLRVQFAELATPANDQCANATAIAALPYASSATTVGSTHDVEFPACGVSASSRGVWYTVVGRGKVMQVSVATGRALSVFRGTCGLGLQCVTEGRRGSSLATTVEWTAEPGITYRIFVAGTHFEDVGAFQLRAQEFAVPKNDRCGNGTKINDLPYVDVGSTEGALSDFATSQCGATVNATSRGVWYEYIGDGLMVEASLGYYDTVLAVFTGSCSSLTCLDAQRGSAYSQAPAVYRWFAEKGERFFLLVTGQSASDTGRYQLILRESTAMEVDSGGETPSSAPVALRWRG